MFLTDAAHYIKESIPTASVLSLYGYSLNRDGFMRCPFHAADRTPSLKVYDHSPSYKKRGWYCFGCHAGGSVIDFVMRHESCDFTTAVRAIDSALHLSLLSVEPYEDQERYRLYQKDFDTLAELLKSIANLEIQTISATITADYHAWAALDRIPKEQRTAQDWTNWHNLREGLMYQEYLLSRWDEYKKEVTQWRNKHRLSKPLTIKTPPNPKSA